MAAESIAKFYETLQNFNIADSQGTANFNVTAPEASDTSKKATLSQQLQALKGQVGQLRTEQSTTEQKVQQAQRDMQQSIALAAESTAQASGLSSLAEQHDSQGQQLIVDGQKMLSDGNPKNDAAARAKIQEGENLKLQAQKEAEQARIYKEKASKELEKAQSSEAKQQLNERESGILTAALTNMQSEITAVEAKISSIQPQSTSTPAGAFGAGSSNGAGPLGAFGGGGPGSPDQNGGGGGGSKPPIGNAVGLLLAARGILAAISMVSRAGTANISPIVQIAKNLTIKGLSEQAIAYLEAAMVDSAINGTPYEQQIIQTKYQASTLHGEAETNVAFWKQVLEDNKQLGKQTHDLAKMA